MTAVTAASKVTPPESVIVNVSIALTMPSTSVLAVPESIVRFSVPAAPVTAFKVITSSSAFKIEVPADNVKSSLKVIIPLVVTSTLAPKVVPPLALVNKVDKPVKSPERVVAPVEFKIKELVPPASAPPIFIAPLPVLIVEAAPKVIPVSASPKVTISSDVARVPAKVIPTALAVCEVADMLLLNVVVTPAAPMFKVPVLIKVALVIVPPPFI